MNILVTGGAGFIGSNFVNLLMKDDYRQKYQIDKVINLDNLSYAGNLHNLDGIWAREEHIFVKGSITDQALVESLLREYDIKHVYHFAAESHVDNSIKNPSIFVETNVLGTQKCLEACKQVWAPDGTFPADVKFIHVSTDEVYGTLSLTDPQFVETKGLEPNSPYSASKAGSDMLVRAYHETYQMPINITRCSNNYGPYQFPEKLIPLVIDRCLKNADIPVYGDGMQIRDWLHVKDHCIAILTVGQKGRVGQVYNVGGNNEVANIDIVKLIIAKTNSQSKITHVTDRLGHDRRYAINNAKITAELGWSPSYEFTSGIAEVIEWYLINSDWIDSVASGEYKKYEQTKVNSNE